MSISGIAGQILKAHRLELIDTQEAALKLQALLKAGRINHKIFDTLVSALES